MASVPSVKNYEVTADCTGPKHATVTVRDLTVAVDAPAAAGGENRGPTPVEYLLVSLAGCFNVTGTHVAAEMGLDLRVTAVSVSGDLDTTMYLTGEGTRAGYDRIHVAVRVETTATAEELETWRRAVERRNPVLDTIARPTSVDVDVSLSPTP